MCSVLQPLNMFPLLFLTDLHPDLCFPLLLTGGFSEREFGQGQFIKPEMRDCKLLVLQTSKQALVILPSQFVQCLSKAA